mmetsp:Transcript_29157/g.83692  ORF Transcript_29157/g.83692 Transcript_29157/m.83692 type:complete len:320 (-) Transcript_29157:386-1345(-)
MRQSKVSPASVVSNCPTSASAGAGTPKWEVPVSTTPRQVPSLQMSSVCPPTRMARICTCQWPCSGIITGAQCNGSNILRLSMPPKAISLSSPSSPSVRKTPKKPAGRPRPKSMSNAEKLLFKARDPNPRPRMPSNLNVLKGWLDISTASTTLISTQSSCSSSSFAARSSTAAMAEPTAEAMEPTMSPSTWETELAPRMLPPTTWPASAMAPSLEVWRRSLAGCPKQTRSRVNSPMISPVPKPIVTWSQASPSGTTEPSVLTGTAVLDALMSNLRRPSTRQASLLHSAAGSTTCPEPVSKTTRNSCAGVPTCNTPEYEVL